MDDVAAGTLYGLWGTLLVLYGFLLGGAIDLLGARGSTRVGARCRPRGTALSQPRCQPRRSCGPCLLVAGHNQLALPPHTPGVKRSLVLCFVLNVASRVVMASTRSLPVMLAALLLPNTAAGALGVPVMTIGVKRYTHAGNRGFAFSLFYSLMNIAALVQARGKGGSGLWTGRRFGQALAGRAFGVSSWQGAGGVWEGRGG